MLVTASHLQNNNQQITTRSLPPKLVFYHRWHPCPIHLLTNHIIQIIIQHSTTILLEYDCYFLSIGKDR